MQLVVHSPFGSRINRAWGLALRKRFCRKFNFELQAAATEDSLSSRSPRRTASIWRTWRAICIRIRVRPILIQALCAAPMFEVRWRWDAGIALALPRFRNGKKIPPQIARMNAEDLLASVFPDQVACAENLPGELEIPDHPLVRQTIRDCLEDAMDADGFENVLRGLESGKIGVVARDVTEPSPLALEVLSARPYAYLDDAPLEERRTQAVMSRRWLDPESAADIGKLDPGAIARVREEAWPDGDTADQLHDALLWLGYLTDAEVRTNPFWPTLIQSLLATNRVNAHRVAVDRRRTAPDVRGPVLCREVRPRRDRAAELPEDLGSRRCAPRDRARASGRPRPGHRLGTGAIAFPAGLGRRHRADCSAGRGLCDARPLHANALEDEWCDRRLLARIHRYTVKRLRAEIEPVQARDFLRFLFEWQRVLPEARMQGPDAVAAVLTQLEGFEAPAGAWETEVLPARITEYEPAWLDEHCLAGRFVWTRLASRSADPERGAAPVRSTPITLLARRNVRLWSAYTNPPDHENLTSKARAVADTIREHGASFFDEIVETSGLLPIQVEEALAELVALGLVNSDSFGGLRALLVPGDRRRRQRGAQPTPRAVRHGRFRPLGAGASSDDDGASARGAETKSVTRKRSSTSCVRCCADGASCSGSCSRVKPVGCRRGAIC